MIARCSGHFSVLPFKDDFVMYRIDVFLWPVSRLQQDFHQTLPVPQPSAHEPLTKNVKKRANLPYAILPSAMQACCRPTCASTCAEVCVATPHTQHA